jgi:hypothetical protein
VALKGIKDTEKVAVGAIVTMLKIGLTPQLSEISERLGRLEERLDRVEERSGHAEAAYFPTERPALVEAKLSAHQG